MGKSSIHLAADFMLVTYLSVTLETACCAPAKGGSFVLFIPSAFDHLNGSEYGPYVAAGQLYYVPQCLLSLFWGWLQV